MLTKTVLVAENFLYQMVLFLSAVVSTEINRKHYIQSNQHKRNSGNASRYNTESYDGSHFPAKTQRCLHLFIYSFIYLFIKTGSATSLSLLPE